MADVRRRSFKCELEKNQMRKTLMVSVAVAALLAATGLATAQGVNQGEAPAAVAPKVDTAAPMNAPAAKGAETAPGAASKESVPQHAQGKPDAKTTGDMKADGKAKASDSTTPATTSKDTKNPTAETKSPSDSKATTGEMKTDSKAKASESTTTSKDLKTPTAETKPSTSDSKTTGNAATSATAAPPAEKRTQITSAIKQEDKPVLTEKLEPLIAKPGFTGNAPGGPSRWSTERSVQWCPLQPKLVVEVAYDHFSGERFRHGTSILRWRPDKAPKQCTFNQLKQKAVSPMKLLA